MIRKILLTILICSAFSLSYSQKSNVVSSREVQALLDKYGKERLIKGIMKLRASRITLLVDGRFREFVGTPASEFVTVETLMRDLDKANSDVRRLEEILTMTAGSLDSQIAQGERDIETEGVLLALGGRKTQSVKVTQDKPMPSSSGTNAKARGIRITPRQADSPPKPPHDDLSIHPHVEIDTVILEGHTRDVTDIAIDPTGSYIASTDDLGKIKLWDFKTGQLLRTYRGDSSEEHGTQVEIDPGGRFLATGGSFKTQVRIWSLTENRLLHVLPGSRKASSTLAIDSSGRFLVGAGWGTMTLWDTKTLRRVRQFRTQHLQSLFTAVAIEPGGKYCFTGHNDGRITRWNLETGAVVREFQGHSGGICKLLIDSSGEYLISAGRSTQGGRRGPGKVKVWDLKSYNLVRVVAVYPAAEKRGSLHTVAIDPKRELIASGGSDGHIYIWSFKGGFLVRRIENPEKGIPSVTTLAGIEALAIDPTGRFIVSGGEKGTIRIWSLESGQLVRKLSGDANIAYNRETREYERMLSSESKDDALADTPTLTHVDPGLRFLVVKTDRDALNIWDLESCELQIHLGENDRVAYCELDPKGRFAVTGDKKGVIKIYDLKTGVLLRQLRTPQDRRMVKWLRIDPKGKRIVSIHQNLGPFSKAEMNTLNIWDLETGRLIKTLRGCRKVQIDPKGRYIAALAGDNTLKIWNLKFGEMDKTFKLERDARFISVVDIIRDGEIIVAGYSDRELVFWNIAAGIRLKTPEVGDAIKKGIEPDPRGHYMLYFTGDRPRGIGTNHRYYLGPPPNRYSPDFYNTATVWGIDAGKIVCRIEGHRHAISSVKIDPTGKLAFSVSEESIKVWNLASGKLLGTLKPNYCITKIAIDPSGKYVVASTCRGLYIFDWRTGRTIRRIGEIVRVKGLRIINDNPLSEGPVILSTTRDDMFRMTELMSGKHVEIGNLGSKNRISPDRVIGDFILSDSAFNGIRLWNIKTGEYLTLVSRGKEWLAYTSKGYFDSSRHGGSLVMMTKGLNTFGIDQFAIRNNRPDIILESMELGNDELITHFHNRYKRRLRKLRFAEQQLSGDLHVPEAEILNTKQNGKFFKIKFKLSDDTYDLERYNIYINDVPLFGIGGTGVRGKEVVLTEKVELCSGKNKIEVTCINDKGAESYRARTYVDYERQVKGDLYYIGFGVSKYKDSGLDLKYADRDAKDLENAFLQMKGHFENVHSKTFVNQEVSVENIINAKQILKDATVDDTVVIFIAGHGVHDIDKEATYYYLTHNTNLDKLSATAVTFDAIEDLLIGVAPRKKLLLMDTCESGEVEEYVQDSFFAMARSRGIRARTTRSISIQLRRAKGPVNRTYLLNRDRYIYNDLTRRSGTIVFSSSKGGEISYEDDTMQNGLFTEAIIKAMTSKEADKNSDRILTSDELRDYVAQSVSEMSDGLQHPTVDRDNIHQKIGFPVLNTR